MNRLLIVVGVFLLVACAPHIEVDVSAEWEALEYPEADPKILVGKNYIRHPNAGHGSTQIKVYLVVDEKGNVIRISTQPDRSGTKKQFWIDQFRPDVEAAATKWKFQPTLKDGKAVAVKVTSYINIHPPAIKPEKRVPFPTIDKNDVRIRLDRTGCFGTCPQYSVQIFQDGKVEFTGGVYTLFEGSQSYAVPVQEVNKLINEFRKADFWSLRNVYRHGVTDSPTYVITFQTGKNKKSIEDYVGLRVGMPSIVRDLQDQIDQVAGTDRWISGNLETIPSLEKANFDFGSIDGQKALVAAIDLSSEELATEFLNKGVSLDGSYAEFLDCPECGPNPKTFARALKVSVQRDRSELFKILDKGGWTEKLDQDQKNELLWHAAKSNNPFIVARLLKKGARFNYGNSSPLIAALDNDFYQTSTDADRKKVVKLLLDAGVNLEAKNGIGYTALQHSYDESLEIVRMLLDAGAEVNAGSIDPLNEIENTSSSLLYLTGDEDIALLAISRGADTSLKSEEGKTLYQLALEHSWKRVVKLLQSQ